MRNSIYFPLLAGVMTAASMQVYADTRAYFPMNVENGFITEKISGRQTAVEGRFTPMIVNGLDGTAWRTDGFTSFAVAQLGDLFSGDKMSVSLTMAVDTYPIIHHEQPTDEQIPIITCLNEGERSGFGFYLGRTGKYSFRMYAGGNLVTIDAPEKLPLWQWRTLTATVDGSQVKLYSDGKLVGSASCNPGVKVKGELLIGWDRRGDNLGGAALGAFNGAIDRISISDTADVPAQTDGGYADLNEKNDRYANDIMRPRFHGMPMMNWTNETHGLIKYGGKYHVFFQKTGSAPIMSHQHWGHLVSEDLINWKDDTPVLAPGEDYDIKGCWSGCVFTDPDINGGKPTILYTGVNYGEPFAVGAFSNDEDLRSWSKDSRNPYATIQQTGESHFRDTYFFREGGQKYFIIGGSKDGKAAAHLYKYENGNWVNNGYFYESPDRGTDGEFAEMPNVVQFGDRWIMTTTPLGGSRGVTCNYRTGRIENGRFIPDSRFHNPKQVDVLAEKGFGLMSPSPYTDENGKVIAMGIVADKLPTQYNLDHGYAHLYSLPREWELDSDGDLLQKPYSGLEALRTADENRQLHLEDIDLNGTQNLAPVRGREVEVIAKFEVGNAPFGFNFYKDAEGKTATLTYNPENHELSVDFGTVERYNQDEGNPNRFSAILEKVPAAGEEMKLHLFIDHSILEIFVNDRYASSVRVFPREIDSSIIEVFSKGETHVASVDAWILNENPDNDPVIVVPEAPEIPETTGKVAMLLGYADANALNMGSQDEKEAVNYFLEAFPEGQLIYANELDKVQAGDYDCIWIHIDRDGIDRGWQNLPAPFNSQVTIDRLKAYLADGGNLYLSTHATQLVEPLGRSDHGPSEFSSGDGGVGNDHWQVNIAPTNRKFVNHPIFYNIPAIEADYGVLINLLGNEAGLHRQDHNCLWNMDCCGGNEGFSIHHNARVLGTWGHNGGQNFAGIVEFLPANNGALKAISKDKIAKRKGTIIANGLAAYEWSCRSGENLHQKNIEMLTNNVLAYLSPKEDVEDPNISTVVTETSMSVSNVTPVYYTLQGIRVERPQAGGVYIRVVGDKTEKVMIK